MARGSVLLGLEAQVGDRKATLSWVCCRRGPVTLSVWSRRSQAGFTQQSGTGGPSSGSYAWSRAHRPVFQDRGSLRPGVPLHLALSKSLRVSSAIQITHSCHLAYTGTTALGVPGSHFGGHKPRLPLSRPDSHSSLCPTPSGKAHDDICHFSVTQVRVKEQREEASCQLVPQRPRAPPWGGGLGVCLLAVPFMSHHTP